MRKIYPLLAAALLAVLLAGCGADSNKNEATEAPNIFSSAPASLGTPSTGGAGKEAPAPSSGESPSGTPTAELANDQQSTLKELARETIGYLRERDLASLVTLVDPEQGLRFSPYSHVNTDSDLVFKPDDFPTFKDKEKRIWGTADGSGEPIELSFRDYYEKFVYNKDFADAPDVSVNQVIGTGNSEFNVPSVYPNASYVELHFPGFDEELDGMDWQSLVLVFVPSGEEWKLAGIVHGQWTI
ncbi:hypothetical protein [Cohnella boryungensis]|uniref:DUF3993 domain-containing protein n=1 Tax=Cohnella boryungensis TaxID=768479 RepID=A0ABV8S7K5_9BACL